MIPIFIYKFYFTFRKILGLILSDMKQNNKKIKIIMIEEPRKKNASFEKCFIDTCCEWMVTAQAIRYSHDFHTPPVRPPSYSNSMEEINILIYSGRFVKIDFVRACKTSHMSELLVRRMKCMWWISRISMLCKKQQQQQQQSLTFTILIQIIYVYYNFIFQNPVSISTRRLR